MAASPDIRNYRIPGAIIEAKFTDDMDYVDLGNLVDFQYTPSIEKKEHFSSRSGTRIKDYSVVSQIAAVITLTLDEITSRNLRMFLLGASTTNTAGDEEITPLTAPNLTADIRVTGTNTIGPMIDFLGNVTFAPSGDLSLQADNDDWSQIPLTADVNKSDDRFGLFTVRQQDGVTA